MKNLILLSLIGLFFGFSQNAFAQTCNDPNAHNTGEMAPCETCFDGIKNGDEIEVDCGGTNPSCPPCDFERRLDVLGDARVLGDLEVQRNIGIGTANPSEELDVIGTIKCTNIRGRGDGEIFNIYPVGNSATASRSWIQLVQNIPTRTGELSLGGTFIKFFSNSTTTSFGQERMRIASNGNVAVGADSSPDFLLEVLGSAGKPGGGSWSNSSDRRLKQDIEDYEDGLEEILQIRPVWYRYNGKFGLPTEERYVGIIAQEMQEVAPYTITPYIETDDKTGESGEYLSYNGTAVTYMLVNAVQEQHVIMQDLKNENEELKERLAKIEAMLVGQSTISNSTINNSSTTLTDAKLYPNQPNPFSEQTLIRYYIPEGSTQAELRIANLEGKVIKTVAIPENGAGQLTVNAHSLSAGTYLYSLIVDGELIATEKMILTGKN